MGTPREYFLGENEKAIGVIHDYIRGRESHQDDLDVAQGCLSEMHESGLIVVSRAEWEKASAWLSAVRAAVQ